jgi:hypothetical protein
VRKAVNALDTSDVLYLWRGAKSRPSVKTYDKAKKKAEIHRTSTGPAGPGVADEPGSAAAEGALLFCRAALPLSSRTLNWVGLARSAA